MVELTFQCQRGSGYIILEVTKKLVKLLGVTVDNKLSFEPHLNLVCNKVSQKLQALARVSKFISKKKN